MRWSINAYIELIRNTPFLVQLFFFFFGLPAIGLRWSPHTAALTAMVVNLGAYATEIIRAGIEAIPNGQIEAGLALEPASRTQIFRFVVLKPALRAIYPALTQPVHPAHAELERRLGDLRGRTDVGRLRTCSRRRSAASRSTSS